MTTANRELKPPRQITGRMVLIGFILFFGTITAVNAVLMYFALNTWPGLVTEDAYTKGLNYNDTIATSESQRRLAWNIDVSFERGKGLRIHIADKNQSPVTKLSIEAALTRPLGDHNIEVLIMSEIQPGLYEAEFSTPLPGRWMADVKAVSSDGSTSTSRHEIMVK